MRAKTKKAVFIASMTAAALASAVGLGVGIVAFQREHFSVPSVAAARTYTDPAATAYVPPAGGTVVDPSAEPLVTLSGDMLTTYNYLRGFTRDGAAVMPARVYNYLRSRFVTTAGLGALDEWAKQGSTSVRLRFARCREILAEIMQPFGLSLPTEPADYPQLVRPMQAIVNIVLADPLVAAVNMRLEFSAGPDGSGVEFAAFLPVPPSPPIVTLARSLVGTELPSQLFPYAAQDGSATIEQDLAAFLAEEAK